jgi:glutathione S-transferase
LLLAVAPGGDPYIRPGRATRRIWTRDALAAEFSDLIAWRDELYAKHRAKPPSAPRRRAQA